MRGGGVFLYQSGDSPLHALHPLGKFICLIALSVGLMQAGVAGAATLAALCALCLAMLRIKPAELFSKGRFLVPLSLFILLFRCLSFDPRAPFIPGALSPALLYIGKLFLVFLLTEAFFSSTRIQELGAALSLASRSLLRREDCDPGFYLALAVNFIPRAFSSYRLAMDAARARSFGGRGYSRRHVVIVLTAFLRSLIKGAIRTAQALESRDYRKDRSLECRKPRLRDFIACAGCLGYCLACLIA